MMICGRSLTAGWLDEPRTRPKRNITWCVRNGAGVTVEHRRGKHTTVSATIAPSRYRLFARCGNLIGSTVLRVVPGPAERLYIERDIVSGLHSPQIFPGGEILLCAQDPYRRVHAVLRDRFGNRIAFSVETQWESTDSSVAVVESGIEFQGEGIVRRGRAEGRTRVRATDVKTGLQAGVDVRGRAYHYVQLRILVKTLSVSPLDSVDMVPGGRLTFVAQGLRSDSAIWEPAAVDWEAGAGLPLSLHPPAHAVAWSISPGDTGSGWIRIGRGNDTRTRLDSLRVRISVPTRSAGPLDRTGESEITIVRSAGSVAITFRGKEFDDIDVAIYNVGGRLVSSFSRRGATPATLVWDYRDMSGKNVYSGLYVLHVRTAERVIKKRILVKR